MGGLISADNSSGKEAKRVIAVAVGVALLVLTGSFIRSQTEGDGMTRQHNYLERLTFQASRNQEPDTARLRWSEADFAK
jgi:hypothetical protein